MASSLSTRILARCLAGIKEEEEEEEEEIENTPPSPPPNDDDDDNNKEGSKSTPGLGIIAAVARPLRTRGSDVNT